MTKVIVSFCILISPVLSLTLSNGVAHAAPPQSSDRLAPTVDLKCRIVNAPIERPGTPWLVELRSAAGVPLRQVKRMAGETFHFKNLVPGIYRIYLWGKGGRASSESIDLSLAPGQKSVEIAKDLDAPDELPQPSRNQVSVRTLATPKTALEELQRSHKAQLEGDEAAVALHLRRAIEIYPDYVEAWNNLGAHYHRTGDYEQSKQSFTKVTELDPGFQLGWCNLGGSLLAAGEFEKAVDANRTALNLRPGDVIANSQLALSYYYLHNYKDAKKYFKQVFDLDPAYPNSPQLYLAHIALAENSVGEAIDYLRSYISYHPNSPDASHARDTLKGLVEGSLIPSPVVRK